MGDLNTLREQGMSKTLGRMRNFGKLSGEYLNRILVKYGIEPVPWKGKY